MTQPAPQPNRLTYQQALAAVAAAKAAQVGASLTTANVGTLSESVASARDKASAWALNLITGLWNQVDVYDGAAVQAFAVAAGAYTVSAQTVVAKTAAAAQVNIVSGVGVSVPGRISNPADVRGNPVFNRDDRTFTIERGTQEVKYGNTAGVKVVDLDEDATTVGMFNRPARTQRYLESQGMGAGEAHTQATQRLTTLIDDNLMLAQRLAEAEVLVRAADKDKQIIGKRRVIHPELSRSGVCGLCIAASDRVYGIHVLRPIHNRCHCTEAVVTENFDPADGLNEVDLSGLYSTAGGSSGARLKRTRYKTDEHGELGPTLTPVKTRKPVPART